MTVRSLQQHWLMYAQCITGMCVFGLPSDRDVCRGENKRNFILVYAK